MDENENLIPEAYVAPETDNMPFGYEWEDPREIFGDEWQMPADVRRHMESCIL